MILLRMFKLSTIGLLNYQDLHGKNDAFVQEDNWGRMPVYCRISFKINLSCVVETRVSTAKQTDNYNSGLVPSHLCKYQQSCQGSGVEIKTTKTCVCVCGCVCVVGHIASIMAAARVYCCSATKAFQRKKKKRVRMWLLQLFSQIFQTNNFRFVPTSANPLYVPSLWPIFKSYSFDLFIRSSPGWVEANGTLSLVVHDSALSSLSTGASVENSRAALEGLGLLGKKD